LKKLFFHLSPTMSLSSQSQRQPLVRLEMNRIFLFQKMFEMLHFEKALIAQFTLTDAGMKVSVEKDKSMLATAYLQKELFDLWEPGRSLEGNSKVFFISLTEFMQCLSISPSWDTHLSITILSITRPIEILLEDNGMVTKCDIAPVENEDLVDIKISESRCVLKCLYGRETPHFRAACSELEIFSNPKNVVSFVIEPQSNEKAGVFSMAVSNDDDGSYFRADFPNTKDLFPLFDVSQSLTHQYQFDLLKPALKAWQNNQKRTNIKMDEYGRMCIEHIVQDEKGGSFIVSFKIMPMSEL